MFQPLDGLRVVGATETEPTAIGVTSVQVFATATGAGQRAPSAFVGMLSTAVRAIYQRSNGQCP